MNTDRLTIAEARELWRELGAADYRLAEESTNGHFLRSDRRREFDQKYGLRAVELVMFGPYPSHVAYRYASEELLRFWERHPRTTWPEFAVQAGSQARHLKRQARAADGARRTAADRAWRELSRRIAA